MTKYINYKYLCTDCTTTTDYSTIQDLYENKCECGGDMTLLSVTDSER